MNSLELIAMRYSFLAYARMIEAAAECKRDPQLAKDKANEARSFALCAVKEVEEQIHRHKELCSDNGAPSSSLEIMYAQCGIVARQAALQEYYANMLSGELSGNPLSAQKELGNIRRDCVGTEDWPLAEALHVKRIAEAGLSEQYIQDQTRIIAQELSQSDQVLIPDIVIEQAINLDPPPGRAYGITS